MSSVQLSICVVCLDICSFICHCVGAIFLVPEVSYRFQNTLCVLTNVGEMLHCAATHNVTHSRCVRIPLSCVLLRRLNSTKYDYTYFSVNTDHVAQYAINTPNIRHIIHSRRCVRLKSDGVCPHFHQLAIGVIEDVIQLSLSFSKANTPLTAELSITMSWTIGHFDWAGGFICL